MIRSYRTAKNLFLGIAILLSGITYLFLNEYTYPFRFVIDEIQVLSEYKFNLYKDVDNDGISERLTPYIHNLSDIAYISLNSINLKNDIGAYHLDSKISKNAQLFFDDFNNDKIKDLIFYSINLDTLFVSILDVKKEHKYVDELPLIIRKPLFNKQWDLDRVKGNLYDFDNDNKNELVTYIQTAHSVPMRGFIIYDFEEQRITKQFISAIPISDYYYITDLNKDSKPEILITTNAPGNFDKNLRYNDWESKFMILNSDLEVIYESDAFGFYPASTGIGIIDIKNEPRIFLCKPQDNRVGNAEIVALNIELEEVNKITFSREISSVATFPITINSKEKLLAIMVHKDKKIIRIYDKDLKIVKDKELDGSVGISGQSFFIDNDYRFNFIGALDDNLFIMNDELEIIAIEEIPSEFVNDDYYLSIGYLDNKVHFLTRKNNVQTLSHLERSLIYSYIIPISMSSIPLFYGFLIIINSFIHYVKKYSDSLKYLLNQEDNNAIIIDHDGILREFNSEVIKKFNFSGDLKIGTSIFSKITSENTLYKIISNAIDKKINTTQSQQIFTELGIVEGEITITPLKSFLGYVYAYLIRIEDRTKIIQHERNLIWAKTAQKIAHDIKTPLSIIQLNLSSIKARIEKEFLNRKVDYFSDIDMIQDEIRRISKLTKDFLKFSNLEKPNFQSVSIKDELQRAVTHFTSFFKNGVEIEINIGDNDLIWGDPNQIEHLFNIFLENAIDAVGGNGYLSISTSEIIDTNTNNTFIQILIKDDGEGIKSEFLNKIYEPYFTTKIEGTGLGLAIAKKIIEDNNGTIDIDSTLGKGTIFKITFPKFSE